MFVKISAQFLAHMEGQIHSVFWTCPVIQILAEVKPVAKIWMHIVVDSRGSQETPIESKDLEKKGRQLQ